MTSDPQLFGLCREADPRIDDLLLGLASTLQANGYRLAGFVQNNAASEAENIQGILLHNLMSGDIHDVSEQRGAGALGCSLDWGALAELASELERQLQSDTPALVVINRFGKAEAEGRGFCAVIETCLERDIPILVAYRTGYAAAWANYHGGYARELLAQSQHELIAELGLPAARKASP